MICHLCSLGFSQESVLIIAPLPGAHSVLCSAPKLSALLQTLTLNVVFAIWHRGVRNRGVPYVHLKQKQLGKLHFHFGGDIYKHCTWLFSLRRCMIDLYVVLFCFVFPSLSVVISSANTSQNRSGSTRQYIHVVPRAHNRSANASVPTSAKPSTSFSFFRQQ